MPDRERVPELRVSLPNKMFQCLFESVPRLINAAEAAANFVRAVSNVGN